jgi:hypothetical protein
MRRLGQALAIAGILLLFSPEWVPFDPLVVRGAALALFLGGLTLAVLASILANLPAAARMDPLADDALPIPCEPLVEDLLALGFQRLGPVLRVHMEPMASLVPLWHPAEQCYATVFHSCGAPGQAHYDIVTVFEPGEAGLTSAANPAAGVLPPAPGAFLQIFPGAAPQELLERHREGRDHLARAAVLRPRPCCDRFQDLLAQALRRQRVAFLRSPLRHTWIALWRVLTKRVPALGPVASQAATPERLEQLSDPRARAETDDALFVGR